jgi:chromosome segregation ATPase
MPEQPITLAVLAKFHREVIVPDIQRIVGDVVSGSEGRLRNEMQGFHDSILKKLGDLETESAAIKIGLKRVEDRLDLVEMRLGRVEERLDKVEQRLDSVESGLRQLDERLSRVEKRIDEIAEPQPGLRAEVQQLKTSIENLQGRLDALERRARR